MLGARRLASYRQRWRVLAGSAIFLRPRTRRCLPTHESLQRTSESRRPRSGSPTRTGVDDFCSVRRLPPVNALRGGLLGGGRVTLDQAQYLSPPHPRESCVGGPEASPLCHCRSHFPLPRGYDSEAGRCWAPGMSPQRGRRSDHLHWRSRRQSGSRQASVRVRVSSRVRSRGRPGRRHGGVRAEPAPRVAQVCSSEHIAEYI